MKIFTKAIPVFILFMILCGSLRSQTSWKGTANTKWSNASNWTNGVPTASKDAILGDANFTGPNQPSVDQAGSCKSLTVGGTVNTTLTASKNLTVAGDVMINANGAIIQANSSLSLAGSWTNNGAYSYSNNNADVIFNGVSQTINGPVVTVFRKVVINNGSTLTMNVNLTTHSSLTVNGTINPNNSPTYTVSPNSMTLNSGSKLLVYAATFAGNYSTNPTVNTGSIVEYASSIIDQTISSSLTYATLIISGSSIKSLSANLPSLNSTAATEGNIFVNGGTFDLGAYTANRGSSTTGGEFFVGNSAVVKIGGTAGFPAGYATKTFLLNSTVEYNGTNQTVTAATYGNLVFSNSGTGAVTKTMPGTAFTIEGNFTSTVGSGTSVTYTAAQAVTVNGVVNIGVNTTFAAASFTHHFGGNWINNGTFTGSTSTVNMNSDGAVISGTGTFNLFNLNINGSATTCASSTNLTLAGNLSVSANGEFTHLDGGMITMTGTAKVISGTDIVLSGLTITGTISLDSSLVITGNLSVSGSFTGNAGTVTMSGMAKTISGVGVLSFNALKPTGTITVSTSFSVKLLLDVVGSLTASSGTTTFTNSSSLNGTANLFNVTINGTSLTLSSNSILGIAGLFTITAGTLNVSSNTSNTVNFNGAGVQTVNAITYHHLMFSTGGTKTAANAVTVNGTITINNSTTFAAGSFTHQVFGNWVNNGSFTAATSTIQFRGADNNTLSGATTFNVLTVNKTNTTNTISLNNNVVAATVNMTNGSLLTGANSITINSTRTGNGIILGTITRTHAYSTGVAYAFEGPDNTITFSSVSAVTSITVYVGSETIPDFPNGASINRVYNITVPAGTYTATLRLHYEDAELNGVNESLMQLWRFNGTAWGNTGKSGNSTVTNYVENSGLTNITNRWSCSDNPGVARWNGSVNGEWTNPSNWTVVAGSPVLPPGVNDVVELGTTGFANHPTITSAVTVKSIIMGSAQATTLTIGSGGTLTTNGNLNGNWTADAVHTINAGNQNINVNGSLALSNGVTNRAINLSIGTGTVTVLGGFTQSGGANVIFNNGGNLNIKGNFSYTNGTFTPGSGTVSYTGTGNQVVAALNYNNLTVNKASGNASVSAALTVGGNLNVSAGVFEVNGTLSVTGNVVVSSGATLDGGIATIDLAGDWLNSGTFSSGSGSVVFNGTGTQTITSTTFNNLIINKSSGTGILSGNLNINGNVELQAGTFDLSTFTCNKPSVGSQFIATAGTHLILAGTNNFPANFSSYNLDVSSTVSYNGTGTQSVTGITYGNLIFSNGVSNAKTFTGHATVNGNFTINSGATLHSGGFTLTLWGNWVNSGVFSPSTGLVVLNGSSKTITGNTIFNRVTVNGSYTVNDNDIVYNGLLNITSTGTFFAGAGIATVNGDLTNSGNATSTGTTTFTGTTVQTIRLVNALASSSTGIVNFNGSVSPIMNSTSSPQFATLNINNTAGIYPSVGWTVFVAMNVNSGASFHGGISTHTIYGNYTNAGTSTSSGIIKFTPVSAKTVNFGSTGFSSTGTVILGGVAALTLSGTPGSLNNVQISNTHTSGISPASNWTLTGKFSINSNSIFNAGTYTYTIGTDIESDGTLNGGTSTFTMTSATGELYGSANTSFHHFVIGGGASIVANSDFSVRGNYTNNGTYDGTIGNLVMSGSSPATIGGTPASNALSQLIIAKDTGIAVTMAVSLTEVFNLHIQRGTLFTSTYGITQDVVGGFLIIDDGATLKLGGTNSLPAFSGYGLDANSNVEYAGTTQSIANAAIYGNLWITATGNKNAIVTFTTLGNFTLTAGTFTSSITVTHYIGGNWLMTGGSFTNTNITIQLNGTNDQSISSTGAFRNLTINKSAGLANLASHITVTNNLLLSAGKMSLLNFNLTINPGATINSATAAKYVIAEGNGTLIQQVTAGGSKVYPVGTAANYVPATIALTGGSTTDNFRVRVKDYVLNQGTNGYELTNFAVDNTWYISEDNAGGSDATVTLQWPASIELSGFTREQSRVSQSSGFAYSFGPLSPAVGSNPYTSSKTNVTVFNAFAVLNNVVVLPVTWLQLSGEHRDGDNHLAWKTANEKPNNSYAVEYSVNGTSFNLLANMPGKGSLGSSNSYGHVHQRVQASVNYYRIKQVDADGSFTYSPIIKIKTAGINTVADASIFPNPVTGLTKLTLQSTGIKQMSLQIYDAAGKTLFKQLLKLQPGSNTIPLNFTSYSPGIYLVEWVDENKVQQSLKVLKR